jgi:single-stranded-DNA-specific exonuclease
MYSVSGNHWEEITINKRIVDKVKLDHRFSEIISKLIVFRKFNQFEIDTIKKDIFLNNPFLNNDDFEQAYKILEETIKKKRKDIDYR